VKKNSLVLPLLLTFSVVFSQSGTKNAVKFANTITVEDAKKHLSVLASDAYEGRETGKEGQRKAAKYIAEKFKESGVKPAKSNDYFQQVPLVINTPAVAGIQAGGKTYLNLEDFYLFPFNKSLKLETNNILFLGYGISEKNEEGDKKSVYDDYKNTDVKGKILLVLGGEPRNTDSVSFITGTKESSEWTTSSRKKAAFAKSKGAKALIVVSSNFESNVQIVKEFMESPSMELFREEDVADSSLNKEEENEIPYFGLSLKMANDILSAQNTNVEDIKKKVQSGKQPISFEIKMPLAIDITKKIEQINSENVLGMVEGTELKDEVIFVTAHYDHLGVHDGKVFNGADDDGSGTAAVIEMAEAFVKAKEAGFGPKRTIVFMTVTGEEKGLFGSSYYTDHPYFPIANTVCDLNIDMIGRFDEEHAKDSAFVYIIGSDKISTDLHKINEKANKKHTKLNLDYKYNAEDDPNRFYYRSDHYNFAEKGVPIIFYFNGVHEDYHQPTDDVEKINFELLVKRAQLVFYTAWEVANRDKRIRSDVRQKKGEK